MVTMGLTHNFQGMMAARWWLGLTEAGLFPGINYYLSCWYKRSEFGIRAAIFFSAAAVSGSFGGLLAAAIGEMDGVGGKKGWAWIFILEGIATVLVGVASFWMVFDFPDEADFLDDADRQRVIRRLKADQQSSAEHENFKMEYFWASVKDWKTWLYAAIYMGAVGPLYAFSLFLPSIIRAVSFSLQMLTLHFSYPLPCSYTRFLSAPLLIQSQSHKPSTSRANTYPARLPKHDSPTPFRTPICSRRPPNNRHRRSRRPNLAARPLQHILLHYRYSRLHSPRCRIVTSNAVHRHLSWRLGNIPLHRQYDRLDQ